VENIITSKIDWSDLVKYTVLQNGKVFCNGKELSDLSQKVNLRSNNKPGVYNFAVEKLIAKRFDLGFSINYDIIVFPEIELEISVLRFLQYGGFDESDEVYFVEDFNMRTTDYAGIKNHNLSDGLEIKNSTFLQKMSLATGNGQLEMSKENSKSKQIKNSESHQLNHSLTLGLTVGDYRLLEQFLSTLIRSFSGNLDKLSLIICCFKVEFVLVKDILLKFKIDPQNYVILNEDWGYEQAKLGRLGNWFLTEDNCSGVSFGRCVLHRALYDFSVNEIIWILDDDIVFEKSNIEQLNISIGNMKQHQKIVGIGAILGDAPLPPAYIVRTQAVDFFYANLTNHVKDWNAGQNVQAFHDIHHDLATSRTDHLEVPLGLKKAKQFDIRNWSIFSGKSITRSIHSNWKALEKVPTRGGNTLLLDRNPLIYWPNVSPNCGGIQFRRGDTIWARLIEKENPELICPIALSLNQIRLETNTSFGSISSIRGDILGSMLTRLIGKNEYCATDVIENSKLRESRLIMNLFRAHYLLNVLRYDKEQLQKLDEFISDMINTPYPEQTHSDLSEFIAMQNKNILNFRAIN